MRDPALGRTMVPMWRILFCSVLTLSACAGSDPAATGRLQMETAGMDGGGGGTGVAGAGGAGGTGTAGAGGATGGTGGATSDGGAGAMAMAEAGAEATPAHGTVTWTFKYCGDNATSVGVIDQTTNKGLAGPVQIMKPRGDVFVLKPVTFSCADGDVICWSASGISGMCGACADAMPVVGC